MSSNRLLLMTCAKALLGCALLLFSVWFVEQNGKFENAPDPNDHGTKRWDYLYQMAKTNTPIDVLVLGNSHAYTGLSPEFLSGALESNTFVLANPGTNVADAFWNLKELLTLQTPKLVALETYAINKTSHDAMSSTMLVDQVKSFNARRNPTLQWASLLPLFPIDDAPLAASAVVRNHHFLWEGFPKRSQTPSYNLNDRYLGRFIRFTSGLSDSLLTQYESEGAVVDGQLELISQECREYTQRIADLCEAHGIQLVLFTLPMYTSHVTNATSWMDRYRSLATDLDVPYLNLQTEGDMARQPEYFENTRKANQHMTLSGAMRAADALGAFIDSLHPEMFHHRGSDTEWLEFHSGNDGIYAFTAPSPTDPKAQLISKDLQARGFRIDQVLLTDVPKKDDLQVLWIRLDSFMNTEGSLNKDLMLRFEYRMGEAPLQEATLRIPPFDAIQRDDMVVYRKPVKRLEITQIKAAALVDRQ